MIQEIIASLESIAVSRNVSLLRSVFGRDRIAWSLRERLVGAQMVVVTFKAIIQAFFGTRKVLHHLIRVE
jgi:hypothetical protein